MREPRYKEPSSEDIVNRQFLIRDRHGNVVVNDNGQELIGAIIDEKSIVKQNLGKIAYAAELSAGIEQLLHPEIGTAVEATGKFWENPYGRIAVSLTPIMRVVYAEDSHAAGDYVRHLHQGINGIDENGKHYNTLNPEAYFWAQNTFDKSVEDTAVHYSLAPFTEEDEQQLALEAVTWFSYYGMPMNMVPADYKERRAYRQYMIDERLEMNPSAERAIEAALNSRAPRPENVPQAIWKLAELAATPVADMVGLVAIGELDPRIREKFGIPFSKEDQKRLDEVHNIAKVFIDTLPDPLRYAPMAYESLVRDRGGHKNARDRLIYRAMSMGKTSVQAVAGPVLKRVA